MSFESTWPTTAAARVTMSSTDVLLKIGRAPNIINVSSNWAHAGRNDSGPTNLVTAHHIDTAWNAATPALFGANQKVGFMELISPGHRVYDAHEAFSQNAVAPTYQNPTPVLCSVDTDCDAGCKTSSCFASDPEFFCDDVCRNGKCVDAHLSKVAGVVSSTRGGTPWSAARASLYFANEALNHCDKAENQQAFEWFVNNDVRIVNESYSCNAADDVGQIEDYYTQVFGVHVIKTAGNSATVRACPNHLNSVCVGATRLDLHMADYSTTQNPVNAHGDGYDREEPDIVAMGGAAGEQCVGYESVDLLGLQSPTDWGGAGAGTSFSAPIVTSMVALLQEKCGYIDPIVMRALLAGAARDVDPDASNFLPGWRYSTPAHFRDLGDGAGFDLADLLGCPTGQLEEIDLRDGVPGPVGDAPPSGPPPQSLGLRIQSSGVTPGPTDGRLYKRLAEVKFSRDGRLRYSVHWNACAEEPLGYPQATVVPDFDLFLFDRTRGRYYYASQSNDDNNEGFDVSIPETLAGTYEVWLAWPDGAVGCGGAPGALFGWEIAAWGAD